MRSRSVITVLSFQADCVFRALIFWENVLKKEPGPSDVYLERRDYALDLGIAGVWILPVWLIFYVLVLQVYQRTNSEESMSDPEEA